MEAKRIYSSRFHSGFIDRFALKEGLSKRSAQRARKENDPRWLLFIKETPLPPVPTKTQYAFIQKRVKQLEKIAKKIAKKIQETKNQYSPLFIATRDKRQRERERYHQPENRSKKSEYQRRWYSKKHAADIEQRAAKRAAIKEQRESNREAILERKRAYAKAYYLANREKKRIYAFTHPPDPSVRASYRKSYYASNREKQIKAVTLWKITNRKKKISKKFFKLSAAVAAVSKTKQPNNQD